MAHERTTARTGTLSKQGARLSCGSHLCMHVCWCRGDGQQVRLRRDGTSKSGFMHVSHFQLPHWVRRPVPRPPRNDRSRRVMPLPLHARAAGLAAVVGMLEFSPPTSDCSCTLFQRMRNACLMPATVLSSWLVGARAQPAASELLLLLLLLLLLMQAQRLTQPKIRRTALDGLWMGPESVRSKEVAV